MIDEVAAVWLVCLMLPQNPAGWLASFAAFRVFDIVKLPPASIIDERMKNGWGIMLDDFFAAVWATAVVIVIDMIVSRLLPGMSLFSGVF